MIITPRDRSSNHPFHFIFVALIKEQTFPRGLTCNFEVAAFEVAPLADYKWKLVPKVIRSSNPRRRRFKNTFRIFPGVFYRRRSGTFQGRSVKISSDSCTLSTAGNRLRPTLKAAANAAAATVAATVAMVAIGQSNGGDNGRPVAPS